MEIKNFKNYLLTAFHDHKIILVLVSTLKFPGVTEKLSARVLAPVPGPREIRHLRSQRGVPVDVATAKGLSIWGGDLPKAFQVSNLARKAHCISCLGSVVIVETGSGRLCGEMTTTPVEHPDIWGFSRERSDFIVL